MDGKGNLADVTKLKILRWIIMDSVDILGGP